MALQTHRKSPETFVRDFKSFIQLLQQHLSFLKWALLIVFAILLMCNAFTQYIGALQKQPRPYVDKNIAPQFFEAIHFVRASLLNLAEPHK